MSRVVLVEVNGAVSRLKISECEAFDDGEQLDCLVLVYSIDDQKSFGEILSTSFLFPRIINFEKFHFLFFHYLNKKLESRY